MTAAHSGVRRIVLLFAALLLAATATPAAAHHRPGHCPASHERQGRCTPAPTPSPDPPDTGGIAAPGWVAVEASAVEWEHTMARSYEVLAADNEAFNGAQVIASDGFDSPATDVLRFPLDGLAEGEWWLGVRAVEDGVPSDVQRHDTREDPPVLAYYVVEPDPGDPDPDGEDTGAWAVRSEQPDDGNALFVAPGGNDGNPGTKAQPFATFLKGIQTVGQSGQPRTLYMREGTYNIGTLNHPSHANGSSSNPIRVTSYPGEVATINGSFRFADSNWWRFDHLHFTGPDLAVRFTNDQNLIFELNDVSVGAFIVNHWNTTSLPANVTVRLNRFRDRATVNAGHQDHGIYVLGVGQNGSVLIERNLFYRVSNGAAVKVGGHNGEGNAGASNVTVRHNTAYDVWDLVSLSQENWGGVSRLSNVTVEGNIGYRIRNASNQQRNVHLLWGVTGANGNVIRDTLWGDAAGLFAIQNGTSASTRDAINQGGHVQANPQFVDAAAGDFHTQNPAAASFGRYAD